MTGDDLKQARLKKGCSQRELARRAGLTHKAVQYWEARDEVDPWSWAMQRISRALGWRISRTQNARTRYGVLPREVPMSAIDRLFTDSCRKQPHQNTSQRVVCGAKTRSGNPCRAKSEPGRTRCRFHGGRSTGPMTDAGRKRIAEAQRRRWQEWRERNQGHKIEQNSL